MAVVVNPVLVVSMALRAMLLPIPKAPLLTSLKYVSLLVVLRNVTRLITSVALAPVAGVGFSWASNVSALVPFGPR